MLNILRPVTSPEQWNALTDAQKWEKFKNLELWCNVVEHTLELSSGIEVTTIDDLLKIQSKVVEDMKRLQGGANDRLPSCK